jgi:hypothetical protein
MTKGDEPMKRATLILAALALLLGCVGTPPGSGAAHAGFVAAVDFTGGSELGLGGLRTLGYAFTPSQSLTIDALMIYKDSN